MTPELLHQMLLDPATSPLPVGRLEHRETHISRLYLTDEFVYKIKKPVDFGFLDFTTLELRRHFCEEEVRLNRRFAPDTYLGVVALHLADGRLHLEGSKGKIVEHAVLMRRLPQERMLDVLIARSEPALGSEAVRLGRTLGELHRDSPVCTGEDAGTLRFLRQNWEENFAQIAPFAGRTLPAEGLALCRGRVEAALAQLTPLLRQREEAGLIRDGHGDLHADSICLTEPLRIIDCIEFNRRFRVGDILADLAFLLMDLDKRGRRDLARLVEAAWREVTADAGDPALLDFYKLYRAFVRGKVESFLAADSSAAAEERTAAAERAKAYFSLGLGYLAPPAVFLTCGLMGVGKSALGRALARALGADLLRSDVLRKELAGLVPEQRSPDPFGAGLYRPEMTRLTYDRLLEQTLAAIQADRPVVVDASFARPEVRERFRSAVAASGAPLFLLDLHCSEALALRRLDERQGEADASDGRAELYHRQQASFIPPAPEEQAIAADTGEAIADNVQQILIQVLHRSAAAS